MVAVFYGAAQIALAKTHSPVTINVAGSNAAGMVILFATELQQPTFWPSGTLCASERNSVQG